MDEETPAAKERQHNLTPREYRDYGETDDSYISSDIGPSSPDLTNNLAAVFVGREPRMSIGRGLGTNVSGEAKTYTCDRAQAEAGMTSVDHESDDLAGSSSQQALSSIPRNEQQETSGLEQGHLDQGKLPGRHGGSVDMVEPTGARDISIATAVQGSEEFMAFHTQEDEFSAEDMASGLQEPHQGTQNPRVDISTREQEETVLSGEGTIAESNIAESEEELSTVSWRRTAPSPGPENINRRSVSIRSSPTAVLGPSSLPSRNVRDFVIPRWQPDAEVTFCPICRTQFSFFVRKHHCRRCGRVVCNACSPHRITIPYQYIVQPPPTVSVSSSSNPEPTLNTNRRNAEISSFADRNGGMKVRLCNPCVPDPNPLPPHPQFEDENSGIPTLYLRRGTRPYSYSGESVNADSTTRAHDISTASTLNARRPYAGTISIHNSGLPYRTEQASHYSSYVPHTGSLRAPDDSLSSSRPSSHSTSPAHSGQFRSHSRNHQSLSFAPGGPISNLQPHYRSLLDLGNEQYTRTTSSNRPLPPVPPHNEEDECPVCHRVLFSRSQANFEERKAAHIMKCIDEQITFHSGASSRPRAHTTHSTPVPASANQSISSSPRRDPPLPTPNASNTSHITPLPAPSIPNTPEARTAAREQAHAAVVFGQNRSSAADTLTTASSLADTSSSNDLFPRRTTGMFIYRASEKDCVDDAECTICLEEFEVGAQMARLECFCRFHRKCIGDWFVDHPGRCPVHQHDGYGL